MLLRERFERVGHFFFKYRGWQPLPMLAILFWELRHFHHIDDSIPYEIFCILISFSGLLVRALTVSFVHEDTSGRNSKEQKAGELNTTGAYSVVRNPLYLANYLILLGVSLLTQNHEVVLLNTVMFALVYVPIIFTEEAFLLGKFGEEYRDYARRVNCFIPSFKGFVKPDRKFSLKMLLKREHDTLLTTTLSLLLIELLREYWASESLTLDGMWVALLIMVSLTWTVLKYLKRTRRLVIEQL